MSPTTVRDQLHVGDTRHIAIKMYELLKPIEQERPATQLQAVVLLFHMLVDHYGLDKREVLAVGDYILSDAAKTRNEHIGALQAYMRNELK